MAKKQRHPTSARVPLDAELAEQARAYIEAQNAARDDKRNQPRVTLAGLLRALLRWQTTPEDAEAMEGWRDLPPDIDAELGRTPRRK